MIHLEKLESGEYKVTAPKQITICETFGQAIGFIIDAEGDL